MPVPGSNLVIQKIMGFGTAFSTKSSSCSMIFHQMHLFLAISGVEEPQMLREALIILWVTFSDIVNQNFPG